jgi:hypothetical protein
MHLTPAPTLKSQTSSLDPQIRHSNRTQDQLYSSIMNEFSRNSLFDRLTQNTRRRFLNECFGGLGALWLSNACCSSAYSHFDSDAKPRSSTAAAGPAEARIAGKAKRVIFLHMEGAPSQLELFDYKPELAKWDGRECPQEFLDGKRFAFIQGTPTMLGPQYPFAQHGQSGAWLSDRLPHFAKVVDDVCFIKSMQTDQFNHGPAQLMVYTGQPRIGYPSVGSWVTWGLGSENEDVPGFMVLLSGGRFPRAGNSLWGSAFLPSVYQGVQCRSRGEPILNVANPKGVTRQDRRAMLDTLTQLNQLSNEQFHDPETTTRIAQYEMAYRMQVAVPELMDLSHESQETLDLYGAKLGKESFANNCLLARRMVESGVRFVQLFDWGWDSHGAAKDEAINGGFQNKCSDIDQAMTGLIIDLKQRGLLDDTLVVWMGEFGRTSMRENRGGKDVTKSELVGRDHNPDGFTMWMAGGGIKRGVSYGATDPMGYFAAENPVTLRDFHATLLHVLGLDHQRLTFPFQGLQQKLSGVKPARVIQEILA